MYLGEVSPETCLPGFDALHSADRLESTVPKINKNIAIGRAYRALLKNDAYADYLRMDKGLTEGPGSKFLRRTGNILDMEDHPEYLEAAGWAFAEAAITNDQANETARLNWLEKADRSWQHALKMYDGLELTDYPERWRADSKPFRLALNLAYTPLMRALVLGDVTDETRRKVAGDTLAIAQLAEVHMHLAEQQGYGRACSDLYGFIHECNIMTSILLLDDPTRVPLPSSSRADSGMFNAAQTHDISLIHQSFGIIEDVTPIEAKKERRPEYVDRYDAILVTRKDLTLHPRNGTIEGTLHLLATVFENRATPEERREFRRILKKLKTRLEINQTMGSEPELDYEPTSPSRCERIVRMMARRARLPAETAQMAS